MGAGESHDPQLQPLKTVKYWRMGSEDDGTRARRAAKSERLGVPQGWHSCRGIGLRCTHHSEEYAAAEGRVRPIRGHREREKGRETEDEKPQRKRRKEGDTKRGHSLVTTPGSVWRDMSSKCQHTDTGQGEGIGQVLMLQKFQGARWQSTF